MKPRILLVRHMRSSANVDKRANYLKRDHAIPGVAPEQATAAGEFLSRWIGENLVVRTNFGTHVRTNFGTHEVPRIRCWHSPYMRTRMTAAGLQAACRADYDEGKTAKHWYRMSESPRGSASARPDGMYAEAIHPGHSLFVDDKEADPIPHCREDILLAEQQFGLFDGLSDEERAMALPRENAYYQKCKEAQGKMWPKMPQGESRFEVCQRLRQFFGTIHRDSERHRIHTHVIVAHGTVNRAFAAMWLHKRYEWMEREANPLNCSVRLIEDGEDKGYIFEGFAGGQHAGQ